MRATMIIPDNLLEKVQRLAGEKSRTKAVIAALESFIKLKGREELLALQGRISIEYDWEREEAVEIADQLEREDLNRDEKTGQVES